MKIYENLGQLHYFWGAQWVSVIYIQVVQEQPQPVQEEPQQQQLQQQSEEGGQGQQQEAAPTTLEELQQALASGQAILQTTDNGSEQTLQMVEGQCKGSHSVTCKYM